LTGTFARDHEQFGVSRENLPQFEPKTFADPPFDPIAYDRIADPARNGYAKPSAGAVRKDCRVEHEVGGREAGTRALQAQKFVAVMKAGGSTEGTVERC
jgi:hypothetical protein